jgi:hypothetical protein
MLALLVAALLVSEGPGAGASLQTAPLQAGSAPVSANEPADLGDVVVQGRPLWDMTEQFVREVGQPARNRGLARWSDGVCVGVVNLQTETAQYIADRVSTVAQDIGLIAGAPGCDPSILIVATIDANAFTEDFVAMRPRLFVLGAAGTDRGYNALREFKTTERPVRWWNVSVPTDSDTGEIAVRFPGVVSGNGAGDGSVTQYAPQIQVRGVSRVSAQIVDVSKRSLIIIDIDKIQSANLPQLADYLAMVSLAQINPDADTSGYATVLNLFDAPEQVQGLTQWDMAYLKGLYDAQRTRHNKMSARNEIASSIMRVHHQLTEAQTEPEGQK